MGHAHAGREPEHGHEHVHDEAFPRQATSALVGDALRGERRRAWVQDGLIALALALLALGLPLERLLGRPVRSDERLHFLAAAASFALGWLVLVRAARRQGWESAPALRASLVAACAPVVLFAATTPGPASAGWLGACIVLAALVEDAAHPLVRGLAWLAACALHPWNAWLWPAWFVRERGWRGRSWALAAALGAGLVLLTHSVWTPSQLFAGFDGGPGPCVAWCTLWITGLGGAALGLLALARAWLAARPRPYWIAAFALVPLVPLSLGGTIGYDLPWLWLAPLGWLGALELERRARAGALLFVGCALVGALALVWVRASDPEREWRAIAEERLDPSDLVLTHSPAHLYLLGTRHGLEVELLPAHVADLGRLGLAQRVREARQRGERVVLDEDSLVRDGELLVEPELAAWARGQARAFLPVAPHP